MLLFSFYVNFSPSVRIKHNLSSFHISTVDSLSVFQSRDLLIAGEVKESLKQGGALRTGNSCMSSHWDGPPQRWLKPQQWKLLSPVSARPVYRSAHWSLRSEVLELYPMKERHRHSEPPGLSLEKCSLIKWNRSIVPLQGLKEGR